MMEFETVLTGGAVLALRRMTGEAMDAVSEALGRYVEYRLRNVGRITENAGDKLGDRLQDETGSVPPRVMMRIFEDGSWSDDDVVVEYLGGVLAGSRTPDGTDDRGAMWATLVAGLSSVALRTHYVIYATLRQELLGDKRNLGDHATRTASTLQIGINEYMVTMGASSAWEAFDFARHAVNSLVREGLIAITWRVGPRTAGVPEGSGDFVLEVEPTPSGIELFNWVHGHGSSSYNLILNPEQTFELATADITLPTSATVRRPRAT